MSNTRVAFLVVGALVATGLSVGAACGQGADWSQAHKLAPNDSLSGDLFGWDVAVSGEIAIVDAAAQSDSGERSGSAYLFDVATGAQLHKFVTDDAEGGDWLGDDVSVSGGVAVVGAPGSLESDPGAAYVFDVASGKQLRTLTADDGAPEDWFGQAVAVSGGIVAVGSTQDDDFGENSGSVYLFDVATGQALRKLNGSEQGPGEWFGIAVGLSGGTVVVGKPFEDIKGGFPGRAYTFGLGPDTCPSDVNGDGVVDFADLLNVLAAWGPCE